MPINWFILLNERRSKFQFYTQTTFALLCGNSWPYGHCLFTYAIFPCRGFEQKLRKIFRLPVNSTCVLSTWHPYNLQWLSGICGPGCYWWEYTLMISSFMRTNSWYPYTKCWKLVAESKQEAQTDAWYLKTSIVIYVGVPSFSSRSLCDLPSICGTAKPSIELQKLNYQNILLNFIKEIKCRDYINKKRKKWSCTIFISFLHRNILQQLHLHTD